jgi:hypothetical protein
MSSAQRLQKAGAWLRRGLRVSLASALVLTSFGIVAARVSYARATDAGMNFGDELSAMSMHHTSGDLTGDAYEVVLNGQPVESSSAATRRSMHDVLDYLQSQCAHNADGLGDKFAHVGRDLASMSPDVGKEGFLVVRREQGDRGFVFCFAGDGSGSASETVARLKRAATTGDFAQLGDVRYASVHKDGTGSQVFTMWTRGAFNIYTMFPQTGDAPGEDFGGVPRPDGSRRTLSGTVVGAPFGISSYEVKGAGAEVFKGVNDKLIAAGFQPVVVAKGVPEVSHFYTLGNRMDVGVDVRETHKGVSAVSYVVSRGVGAVSR